MDNIYGTRGVHPDTVQIHHKTTFILFNKIQLQQDSLQKVPYPH